MRVIADLHLHSKYSRATSTNMNVSGISRFAQIKGLNLVGTGDFTHPKWLRELKENLVEVPGTGLYRSANISESKVWFMVTGEVSTVFTFKGARKKIHHVILTASIEIAEQINDQLSKYGSLEVDGRPTLNMSAPHLVEEIMEISRENMVFPAHAWTPWFSVFGAFSGFDRMEDCYQDMTKHIYALETGLSCYDAETEVLTENGWRSFSEIDYSDRICTLNPETNEIEFQHPTGIFVYNYEGKMYKLETKRVNLLVTPNHKLFYSPCDFRNPKPFRLKEARFLFNKSKRFKKDGVWKGENKAHFMLPAVKIKHGNRYYRGFRVKSEKKIPMESWLKFFGLWLAGGWISKGKHGDYNVYISNQNQDLLKEMETLLTGWGYKVYKYANTLRVRDYQLFHHLKQFGKSSEKFIPKEIKSLSKNLLEILLQYYLLGNGDRYGRTSKGLSATTTSTRLRDDLQEIALKIGISAYYKLGRKKGDLISKPYKGKVYKQRGGTWVIYFIRQNQPIVLPSMIKKYNHIESWVDYKGLVFCASVPNHVIYIRRNGIPLWCGNSDPPMNWRLSALDRFALLSNSDSHSSWPWRIGREANVFELKRLTYWDIIDSIRNKDPNLLRFTIETNPAYGKYHWSGHRTCGISLPPEKAIKLGDICPVCHRRLTKGVEQRVEELADRPYGFRPAGSPGYMHLLPLSEVIASVIGARSLGSRRVWSIYNALISHFGNEYAVLIDASFDEMVKVAGPLIAEAVIRVREERVKVIPGYDGLYGQIIIFPERGENVIRKEPKGTEGKTRISKQKSLSEFF